MGLIKAALSAINTTLADEWKEYIYCDTLDGDTLMAKGEVRVTAGSNTKRSDNIISDGSKIAVNEGQFMLIVENGKVVDFTSEAGAYTYKTDTEPSLFDTGFAGVAEAFAKVGKRFTYGGMPENDQRVYFINTKEIMNNKVGIGDVPFRDSEFNFSMKIQGYGNYSYKITNPVMFYTNVCANVKDRFKKISIDEQLKTEVQSALQPALGRIALKGIAYDQLPLYTKDIAAEVNNELTAEWNELRGISIVSVAFSSIKPDEESAAKIAQMQESRVYTNASMLGARLGTAQAQAMQDAAKNNSGAVNAFMGMGMVNSAAGNQVQNLMNMGEAQKAENKPVEDSWKCSCGHENTGKFCSECGKAKPEKNEWICSCGKVNTGNFCSECGKAKPENNEWTCSCGAKNTGKFCSECGKAHNS